MKSIAIGPEGARLRFLEFGGQGVPLIMVHGLGCASSFEYPHVARAPALAGRQVLLIDLFGFGYSDHPQSFGYRVADHALALAQFVKVLGLGPIDLYGHSMGGTIAIEAAELISVRSLVLSEANLDRGGGQFSRDIAANGEAEYVAHGHHETVAAAWAAGNTDWAATMWRSAPKAVYRGAKSLVDGAEPSWRERFYRLPVRKGFIFGDRSLPDSDADRLSRHGISVFTVPEAGHSMGLENPAGLAAAVASASIG